MARTKKVVVPVVSKDALYLSSIKILGRTYLGSGLTASEAISNLKPKNCKGRCILIVEHRGVKKEKILAPNVVTRLFNTYGLINEIALRQVSSLFQGI